MSPGKTSTSEIADAVAEAFVFSYPLVLMDRLRASMTAVAAPVPATLQAPVNEFVHARGVGDPGGAAVASPGADVVRSSAWLDLGSGPIVLSVPDMRGRYFVLSIIDMWTSVFASVGARTTGTDGVTLAILGPGSSGIALPPGMRPIASPTGRVRIVGQTQIGGAGCCLSDGDVTMPYRLEPLNGHRAPRSLPAEPGAPAVPAAEQVARMDARTFFGAVERLLAIAPPRTADRAAVESMRRGGLLGSHDRGPALTGAVVDNGVADGMRNGLALVQAQAARPPVEAVGQWHIRYRLGQFGTDYLRRAGAACAGLVTESAADEVPAVLRTDADGRPLSGKHWYVLRFAPDRPPPVHGFWSLSTYDGQGSVAPCAARASIGDADGLTVDIDGSLPIHIQPEPPAGRGNWLAAPPGDFTLVLRLFWPLTEVLERRWRPPEVTRVG